MQWDHPCQFNAVEMNYSATHELSIPNEEAHCLVGNGHSVDGLAVVGMHKSLAYLSRYLRSVFSEKKKKVQRCNRKAIRTIHSPFHCSVGVHVQHVVVQNPKIERYVY